MAKGAGAVYQRDIGYGSTPWRRGHWIDRVRAMDKDLLALASKLEAARQKPVGAPAIDESKGLSPMAVSDAIDAAVGRPMRPAVKCDHTPPVEFQPGGAVSVALHLAKAGDAASILLHYRHVNQGERWVQAGMEAAGGDYTGTIPAEYTQSPFALQYYFELRGAKGEAWLYPAFNATLSNQPYFAVSKRSAAAQA
jgi:hypothetical protein